MPEIEVDVPKRKIVAEVFVEQSLVPEIQLPGVPGQSGYTPVRGKDYFTEADITSMVDAVASRFTDGDKEAY